MKTYLNLYIGRYICPSEGTQTCAQTTPCTLMCAFIGFLFPTPWQGLNTI